MSSENKECPGKKLAKIIVSFAPLQKIARSFIFVYRGQTPNVALFVRRGVVLVGDKKISIHRSDRGRLLYFSELVERRACEDELSVLEGAEVSIIDRQVAEKIMNYTCLEPGELTKS